MSKLHTFPYTGAGIGSSPVVVDNQTIIFCYTTATHTVPPTAQPTIASINMVSGKVNWTFIGGTQFETIPAVANNTVYAGNYDGNLYAVNLETGALKWKLQLGGRLGIRTVFDPVSGLVFTGDANGQFYAVDPVNQTLKWSFKYPTPLSDDTVTSPAAVSGGAVFTSIGIHWPSIPEQGFVYAFNAATGASLWQQNMGSGVSAPLVAGDGLVIAGCFDGTVRALDQNTGSEVWRFSMGACMIGQPAYDNGMVYCGSTDGSFYARATHPPPLTPAEWVTPVNSTIPSGVAVANNTAFFGAADSSGNGFFYALPLNEVKHTPTPLTKALTGELLFVPSANAGQVAFCTPGIFGGTLYMIDTSITGADASGTSNADVETTPEPAEAAASVAATPDTTADDKAAMTKMAPFKCQLIVDQYDVSGATATPSSPAFQMMLSLYDENQAPQPSSKVNVWASEPLTITAGGQNYSIGTTPTTLPANAAGQLMMTSPAALRMTSLFLQPDFFKDGFFLTALPNLENFRTLSNLQASDLDPSTALGYDGQPILPASYQDATSRTNLANSISNTVGRMQSQNATMAVVSASDDPPVVLSYQSGAVPNFTVDFSNGISFTQNSSTETEITINPAGGITGTLGFLEFITNVVNGTEAIAKIVWQFASNVASAIIQGAENVYNFVVQTVDDAMQVATGIFKQIVADVDKVFEWLSYLFSWDDILTTHTTIKTQVMSTIGGFQTWLTNELKGTTNDVDTFFNSAETGALNAFNDIITKLGNKTVSGVRQIGGDPNAAYSAGGQDITAQANWLPRKFTENASGANFDSLTAGITGDSSPSSTILGFFTSVGTQITTDPALQSLPTDISNAITALGKLFTGSGGFLGQSLADVLAVVRDLVVGLISLGKAVCDAFLQLIQNVVQDIIDFFTKPITIPFLSDFYQAIAGAPLSLLDLFCLIVAVPTTIVYKLLNETADRGPAATINPSQELLGIANTFTLLLLLPLWIAADLTTFPSVFMGIIAATSFAQGLLVLFLMMQQGGETQPDYLLWVFQFFSVILACLGAWIGKAWAPVAPSIYGGYGFGMMVIYAFYAFNKPKLYFEPDGEPFINNVCSSLPYLGQPLSYIEGIGTAATVLIDTVGYGVSSALSTILFWKDAASAGESAAHA